MCIKGVNSAGLRVFRFAIAAWRPALQAAARSRFRIAVRTGSALAVGLLTAVSAARAQVEIEDICGPEHLQGRLDLHEIGPAIAGQWTEYAQGTGFTKGLQIEQLRIDYNDMRNRAYIAGGGARVELKPVRRGFKPMRWDYLNNKPMDPEAFAPREDGDGAALDLQDLGVLSGCEFSRLPQFEWTYKQGNFTSGGILTFLSPSHGVGVKWNSASGSREQILYR